jgi:D-alanyl-D-alanine carboxypeptidase/D-alanyl-D-alanine-endopeptidase (penicillin-binding protein 4)
MYDDPRRRGAGRSLGHARDETGSLLRAWTVVAMAILLLAAAGGVAYEVGLRPGRGTHGAALGGPGTPSTTRPPIDLPKPPAAPAVLAPASARTRVTVAGLRAHLAGVLAQPGLGRRMGFAAQPLGDSRERYAFGARDVIPASTMKLLTTTAALDVLGPDHRFVTSVVRGAGPGSIVLVGGGDPLLADRAPTAAHATPYYPRPATLQALARATAANLTAAGIGRVHLAYDDSLFSGPAINPAWPSTYIPENVVSPINALWVNEGRDNPGLAQRSANPALAATADFQAELQRDGIRVGGPLVQQPAPAQPALVASVQSAPLVQIVQHILEDSDNEGAEVLLRQVALATGRPGSSQAGVVAVRSALARLGLDLRGAVFYDGSGLSRNDRLPVALLLAVLQVDASPAHPSLRGVVTGLPVAGFSGSLAYRFIDDAPAGLGDVRAKTGTLTGVDGLAGLATTPSGATLVFVAVADKVPVVDTLDARADLDRIAAALTTCGCHVP